jgi:hypothetical protein
MAARIPTEGRITTEKLARPDLDDELRLEPRGQDSWIVTDPT